MNQESQSTGSPITLPTPSTTGSVSIEQTLHERRSTRFYQNTPLTLAEVSQLLWAAQGKTVSDGRRAAPSAGALYPLETYLVITRVNELDPGVYRYEPANHHLSLKRSGEFRDALAQACLGQDCVSMASACIVITGIYERAAVKYGSRAERYTHMEVGHVAENVHLQAVPLRIGTVVVGAFDDDSVGTVVGVAEGEGALCVLPLGRVGG